MLYCTFTYDLLHRKYIGMNVKMRFNATVSSGAIQEALDKHGCAIVENVLSMEDLTELNRQIVPHLEATIPDDKNAFNGSQTKRFGRLLYRVPMVRDMVRHPVVIGALDGTLLPLAPTYKVTFTGVIHVMAGESAQVLHRDNTPFENPAPSVLFAAMWAAEDFQKENGATVFVPGSHLWSEDRHPTKDELQVAEMPAGSVLLYVGNLIHGSGNCVMGTRTGVSLQYAVSWLQQEENQALAVPFDIARTFDEDLLKLMGYDIIARNCGEIDSKHPLDFLLQDGKNRGLATPGYEYSNGTVRSLRLKPGAPRTADHHYHVSLDD